MPDSAPRATPSAKAIAAYFRCWMSESLMTRNPANGLKLSQALKSRCRDGTLEPMSLAELKDRVLALAADERHQFAIWINKMQADYGDGPGEALDQLAADVWDQDDR